MTVTPTYWRARCRPLRYRRPLACVSARRPLFCHDRERGPRWLAWLGIDDVQTVILDQHEDIGLLWLLKTSRDWTIDFAEVRRKFNAETQICIHYSAFIILYSLLFTKEQPLCYQP
jgi:hypothetical protein